MKLIMLPQTADHVPAQAIDVDPPTRRPFRSGRIQELIEGVILQLASLQMLPRKVHSRNLTFLVELRRYGDVLIVRWVRIRRYARFLPRLPLRPSLGLVEGLDGV